MADRKGVVGQINSGRQSKRKCCYQEKTSLVLPKPTLLLYRFGKKTGMPPNKKN